VVKSLSLSFQDEAFGLWREQWANLYEENSTSRQIINSIHDNYFLVNLVDNNFPQESCLFKITKEMVMMRQQKTESQHAETEMAAVNL
jgi:methylenetetrahydrofolate reductase (NADPH)